MSLIESQYRRDLTFESDLLVSASGDLQTISGQNNVKQALIHRTITEPGSLVHRPDYGVGLKRFLNSVNNIDNRNALANKIKVQWELDDRVDEVIGVSIQFEDSKPEQLVIAVRANLVGIREVTLSFQPFNQRVVA